MPHLGSELSGEDWPAGCTCSSPIYLSPRTWKTRAECGPQGGGLSGHTAGPSGARAGDRSGIPEEGGGDFVLPVPGDPGKGFPEVGAIKLGLES